VGAVPVPVGNVKPASTGKETSMRVSVFIEFLPGHAAKEVEFLVLPSAKIAHLKRALYDEEGIPLDRQLLEYKEKIVEERRTASECGIRDESKLYLKIR
jgi:hypothetical protein